MIIEYVIYIKVLYVKQIVNNIISILIIHNMYKDVSIDTNKYKQPISRLHITNRITIV